MKKLSECHIKETLADVFSKDEYLDKFMDSKERIRKKALETKRIYSVIMGKFLSRREISALKDSYYILEKHPELFAEIKKNIGKHEDLLAVLDNVCDDEKIHHITDSYRIEFLKDTLTEYYTSLYNSVRYFGLPASYLMDILPSKKFMEDSIVEAKRLNATKNDGSLFYVPAQDLVYFRSLYGKFEKEMYPQAKPDEKIFISYTEYGRRVYSSFTKAEYEKDLEAAKVLRKSKGEGYVGW